MNNEDVDTFNEHKYYANGKTGLKITEIQVKT